MWRTAWKIIWPAVALLLAIGLLPYCLVDSRCQLDEDCNGNQFCDNGQCRVRQCSQDGECGQGQYCLRYRCQVSGAPAPDFALRDINPRSATYDRQIGPRDFRGHVVLLDFAFAS